ALFHSGKTPPQFAILIVDRTEINEGKLLKHLFEGVKKFTSVENVKSETWKQFAQHIHFQPGDFKNKTTYTTLSDRCAKMEKEWKVKANHIFYMATPPLLFGEISKYLNATGLNRNRQKSRIVVEKPFGYDFESAQKLNRSITDNFD